MALDFKETKQIEELKQKHKVEFEELRHNNRMKELEKTLEIAKSGGDTSEGND